MKPVPHNGELSEEERYKEFLKLTKGKKITYLTDRIDYIVPEGLREDGSMIGPVFDGSNDTILNKDHNYMPSSDWYYFEEGDES